MSEARYVVRYDISLLGRATFVVFLAASLAGVAFVAIPVALLGLQAGGETGWLSAAGALVFALVCAAFAMMSGLRAFGPGERFSLTNEGFKYDGLFRVTRVRWNKVDEFKLKQGDFISHLVVKVHSGSHGKTNILRFDVGGLKPPANELARAFAEATGLKAPTEPAKAPKAPRAKAAKGAEEKAEAL